MHFLKLAKIFVVLIKKRHRKCGLALPEENISQKHMHSFKNRIIQFLRKMRALIIFHINNIFTDISTKHKMIAICKKQLAKLRHKFLFYTYRKEKHN